MNNTIHVRKSINDRLALGQCLPSKPWFRGFYWWKWDEHQSESRPHYYTDPAGDQGFTLAGKPAEATLRDIFGKQFPS